ncbi:MAG: 6-phosphofructokinase [Treponema sp. GWB1_62_6]|nr:MAG: 6-phosphofructokinase [Treponema sp. GWA1_62_8]OHE66912.1 MAG: 6-phosphofructokinase [Treponema sp. GWB1_62_6]OHE69133.1 MAG: 6-phosphofructokinase [Treponema sp. GWC1_61_84]OHE75408.1 MAG: 6-phosphofructokinase [Treponema sp. RIFOXYC1_FULL_61_9]HCM27066.1 6-phosphofructokinase [Treponema sp.]
MTTKTFGILTSGGDCPGLNAAIRGVCRAAHDRYNMTVIGIANGYRGLIDGDARLLKPSDFSGILTRGGTILGTSREKPFKERDKATDAEIGEDKVEVIKDTYRKLNLDCLVVLGGNGTNTTGHLLSEEGLNVVGLPKTIDNDIYGTDMTFGFHSAVTIATEAIDRLHSTAHSHNRVMIIELMGHKAGWLSLYAGVAGGGDIILLPEIPYEISSISRHLLERARDGKSFSIVVVAEGAVSRSEAEMDKKARRKHRTKTAAPSIGYRVAKEIEEATGMETRVTVLGYLQRGGIPSPWDRVLATGFGTAAAALLAAGDYGKMVALKGTEIGAVELSEVAGRTKTVPADHYMVDTARSVGTCFGDS